MGCGSSKQLKMHISPDGSKKITFYNKRPEVHIHTDHETMVLSGNNQVHTIHSKYGLVQSKLKVPEAALKGHIRLLDALKEASF